MSEKTEQPTQKKLRDARDRGEVMHSKDGGKAILLLVFILWALCVGPVFVEQIRSMFDWAGMHANEPFRAVLGAFFVDAIESAAALCGLLLLAATLLTSLVEFLIVGPVFSLEAVEPKLSRLDPISKITQWFSMSNLVEVVKSLLKVTAVVWLTYYLVRSSLNGLVHLPDGGIAAVQSVFYSMFMALVGSCAALFLIVAGADLFLQKILFTRDQMMTKDETKREHNDMMGNPEVRQERKRLQGEILEGNVEHAVRQSSAIVVNPTHVAVGLRYSGGVAPIPMITVMGRNARAQMILRIATREGIPVVKDVELAWALLRRGAAHRYVPLVLTGEVDAILRALEELKP